MIDHPFAHVALRNTPLDEADAVICQNLGAREALLAASKGKVPVRTAEHWSSADMRQLAIHGLTKTAGNRLGVPQVEISPKGREVLGMLSYSA